MANGHLKKLVKSTIERISTGMTQKEREHNEFKYIPQYQMIGGKLVNVNSLQQQKVQK